MSATNAIGNTIGTGMLALARLPLLGASVMSAAMLGELATKAITVALRQIGFRPSHTIFATLTKTITRLRPFENESAKFLAISAVSLLAIGLAGNEVLNLLGFGRGSTLYNRVLALCCLNVRFTRNGPIDEWTRARDGRPSLLEEQTHIRHA